MAEGSPLHRAHQYFTRSILKPTHMQICLQEPHNIELHIPNANTPKVSAVHQKNEENILDHGLHASLAISSLIIDPKVQGPNTSVQDPRPRYERPWRRTGPPVERS